MFLIGQSLIQKLSQKIFGKQNFILHKNIWPKTVFFGLKIRPEEESRKEAKAEKGEKEAMVEKVEKEEKEVKEVEGRKQRQQIGLFGAKFHNHDYLYTYTYIYINDAFQKSLPKPGETAV